MSETVRYTGKLKEIKTHDIAIYLIDSSPDKETRDEIYSKYDFTYENDLNEMFWEYDFCEDFVLSNGKLYEIISKNKQECEYEFFEATKANDIINFHVMYYNGGCGFSEAINEAIDNIKEEL